VSKANINVSTRGNASKLHKTINKLLREIYPYNIIQQEMPVKVKPEGMRQRTLYFDFVVRELDMYIECQGRQHFEKVGFYHQDGGFERQKQNDQLKRDWCKSNGYIMVELPYHEDYNKDLLYQYIDKAIADAMENEDE